MGRLLSRVGMVGQTTLPTSSPKTAAQGAHNALLRCATQGGSFHGLQIQCELKKQEYRRYEQKLTSKKREISYKILHEVANKEWDHLTR